MTVACLAQPALPVLSALLDLLEQAHKVQLALWGLPALGLLALRAPRVFLALQAPRVMLGLLVLLAPPAPPVTRALLVRLVRRGALV